MKNFTPYIRLQTGKHQIMLITKTLLLLTGFILLSAAYTEIYAQQQVTGVVYDEKKITIPGVI